MVSHAMYTQLIACSRLAWHIAGVKTISAPASGIDLTIRGPADPTPTHSFKPACMRPSHCIESTELYVYSCSYNYSYACIIQFSLIAIRVAS